MRNFNWLIMTSIRGYEKDKFTSTDASVKVTTAIDGLIIKRISELGILNRLNTIFELSTFNKSKTKRRRFNLELFFLNLLNVDN